MVDQDIAADLAGDTTAAVTGTQRVPLDTIRIVPADLRCGRNRTRDWKSGP